MKNKLLTTTSLLWIRAAATEVACCAEGSGVVATVGGRTGTGATTEGKAT